MVNNDLTDCDRYKGHVYPFAKGHGQDCVWSGASCLPEVIGLHYIPPPPEEEEEKGETEETSEGVTSEEGEEGVGVIQMGEREGVAEE
jgi:hypothetical protein